MKIKILDKKENRISKREDITFEVSHLSMRTPTRKETLDMCTKELKCNKEFLVLINIKNIYGEAKSIIITHLYKNCEDIKKNEPKFIIKRNTFKIEEKKEEIKEEIKKEVKKEEIKKEVKKEEIKTEKKEAK